SIVFSSDRDGIGALYWKRTDGSGEAQRLTDSENPQVPWSWHPDGRDLAIIEKFAGRMWNLVGFQTRMRTGAQRELLQLIPGLAKAEVLRWGSIHRNTYLNSPAVLSAHSAALDDPLLLFAGQLVGVEGYTESIASGLMCGINLARMLVGEEPVLPPEETMLGSLLRYVSGADPKRFQPMNANFGLVPPLMQPVRDKRVKREAIASRALEAMALFLENLSGVPR
ncbi:MAG: FAD-dependent oxidoreductase, partial [Gemmatimonadetes bacterium]|nr:FAD-dependent oxidoreductase [Gemmatimonadota bacterium]